jgi:hypothetical protein
MTIYRSENGALVSVDHLTEEQDEATPKTTEAPTKGKAKTPAPATEEPTVTDAPAKGAS